MKAVAALLAVLVLVVGCGRDSGDGAGDVVVGDSELVPSGVEPWEVPVGPDGLARCEDIPELRSQLDGTLGGRQNPDHIVEGVLATYAMEHPDTFGGRWIDRASGGVLVLGFTDDPEPHRAAILARRPTPDDYPVVDPPPPITDDRPLGERDGVVVDVVQVRFSEAEVEAMRDRMWRSISREEWREFGLDGTSYDVKRQRVTLYLVNPPEGAIAEIAERIPDPSAVCVDVTRTPQPPEGPLAVIPDLAEEDPLVSCPGTPPVRYSQMINPPSIDEVDHPAVDVLRAELDTPGGEPLPRGRWVVISIDSDRATFAALSEYGFGSAVVERRGDRWIFAGEASGRPCEPVIALPPGLARVEVTLAHGARPEPEDTTVDVLVTEQGCASGREMGDALRGPQVVETDDAVLVAFAVVPVAGMAACPDNPATAVTVELSAPLGQRGVYDGLHFPPEPLVTAVDEASVVFYDDACRRLSTSLTLEAQNAQTSGTFETPNKALLAHLGDLSEPFYDIEVLQRGFGWERWEVAVEDSDGALHVGRVDAVETPDGQWQIGPVRWCLYDAGMEHLKQILADKHEHLQAPASFSACPMMSDTHIDYAEDAVGRDTPGELLSEPLKDLPVASYRIEVTESSDSTVRWQITIPAEPWGLTYGKIIVDRNNGWWLRTFEWCHMEPDRL
ncbi:MAG: hypothetical protein OXC06_09705 [Acidimicrobiaceae bacterium]|nr:hypothetical protein [Acidimicrobiaceae bacterium]